MITQGVVAGMSEGKGYVDVSTVDAATSRQIANAIRCVLVCIGVYWCVLVECMHWLICM